MRPQPSTIPISESFTGDISHRIEGITDHHIPLGYESCTCIVHEFNTEMRSFQTLVLKGSFTISGNPDLIKDMYREQQWKFHRTLNLLKKYPSWNPNFDTPAPLFALLLNKNLQVVDVKLKIAGKTNLPVIFDQSCELLLLPNSYPPLTDLPKEESYSYYDKKATIVYSEFLLEQCYIFEIELEANAGTFEFAPVFPFGSVTIENFTASSSEYDFEPVGIKVKPTFSKRYPEWYEDSINHKVTMEPRRPRFIAASPFRGCDVLFDLKPIVLAHNPKTTNELDIIMDSMLLDLDQQIQLKQFETVRFAFMVVIPVETNIEINVRTIQRALPTRIYEQMQSLSMYQDVLVRYDLFNFTRSKLRVRVETEILDYTEKARKVICVAALNNSRGKKVVKLYFSALASRGEYWSNWLSQKGP